MCLNCKKSYKIQEGIPIMINLENLPKQLQNQIEYFENESVNNDMEYKLGAWQENYVERFTNNFREVNNKTIVDCGTGSGYMAIELAKKGGNIIACDLTLKSLTRLKDIAENLGLSDKIFFVCCSAEILPFKKDIVDYFISNAILEHLPREAGAIREINRVCKSKSGLMITVPLNYKYLNPFFFPINYIHDLRIGHLRRYNKEILEKKFSSWKLLNVYYTGHFLKVIKTIINHFVRIFDEKLVEKDDKRYKNKKWGGSNLIVMLKNNRKI
ncbi:methyltransferase domain-containing protein [Patescibacteria group bacterium]|nr:methyltransferase domain-containing protein [Patescibacteria group bacterium]